MADRFPTSQQTLLACGSVGPSRLALKLGKGSEQASNPFLRTADRCATMRGVAPSSARRALATLASGIDDLFERDPGRRRLRFVMAVEASSRIFRPMTVCRGRSVS